MAQANTAKADSILVVGYVPAALSAAEPDSVGPEKWIVSLGRSRPVQG